MVDRQLSSPEPHYFIVLNRAPLKDQVLLLAVASSQINKVKARCQRKNFPTETVVEIGAQDYQDFTKDSCVNCNQVFTKSLAELVDQWNRKEVRGQADISGPKLEELITGVTASPMVAQEEKDLISPGTED